jgi:Alcohol dehydrogenase GroES-like domain
MGATYGAIGVTRLGRSKTRLGLQSRQVRIRVKACGVCHSDSATVDGVLPGVVYPRVRATVIVKDTSSLYWQSFWLFVQRDRMRPRVDRSGGRHGC